MGLRLRKLADTSGGAGVFLAESGPQRVGTQQAPAETWPLAGVRIEGDVPDEVNLSTAFVADGITSGWIEAEGEEIVHRPGGPPGNQWAVTHTFRQFTYLTLRTVDGDHRYQVVHNPDKYADYEQATWPDRVGAFTGTDQTPVSDEVYAAGATRVDWFYTVKRVGG